MAWPNQLFQSQKKRADPKNLPVLTFALHRTILIIFGNAPLSPWFLGSLLVDCLKS